MKRHQIEAISMVVLLLAGIVATAVRANIFYILIAMALVYAYLVFGTTDKFDDNDPNF